MERGFNLHSWVFFRQAKIQNHSLAQDTFSFHPLVWNFYIQRRTKNISSIRSPKCSFHLQWRNLHSAAHSYSDQTDPELMRIHRNLNLVSHALEWKVGGKRRYLTRVILLTTLLTCAIFLLFPSTSDGTCFSNNKTEKYTRFAVKLAS